MLGSGKLRWTEEDDLKSAELRRGDVYRVEEGSVFFLESNLETERPKLRIHALFANSNNALNVRIICMYINSITLSITTHLCSFIYMFSPMYIGTGTGDRTLF